MTTRYSISITKAKRHKYQRMAACFKLVFRAEFVVMKGGTQGKAPGEAGTGDAPTGSPELAREENRLLAEGRAGVQVPWPERT